MHLEIHFPWILLRSWQVSLKLKTYIRKKTKVLLQKNATSTSRLLSSSEIKDMVLFWKTECMRVSKASSTAAKVKKCLNVWNMVTIQNLNNKNQCALLTPALWTKPRENVTLCNVWRLKVHHFYGFWAKGEKKILVALAIRYSFILILHSFDFFSEVLTQKKNCLVSTYQEKYLFKICNMFIIGFFTMCAMTLISDSPFGKWKV